MVSNQGISGGVSIAPGPASNAVLFSLECVMLALSSIPPFCSFFAFLGGTVDASSTCGSIPQ